MRYRNGALTGCQIVIWQFDQIKYFLTWKARYYMMWVCLREVASSFSNLSQSAFIGSVNIHSNPYAD